MEHKTVSFAFDVNSEIQKLGDTVANPANLANPSTEVSNISRVSRDASSNLNFVVRDASPNQDMSEPFSKTFPTSQHGKPAEAEAEIAKFYRNLFLGQGPIVTVTLDDKAVMEAIRLGVLDDAEGQVILAYRNLQAHALIKIPADRYDGLAILHLVSYGDMARAAVGARDRLPGAGPADDHGAALTR